MIVIDIRQLNQNKDICSKRFRFCSKQKLIFSPIQLVVKLSLTVENRTSGCGGIVDEKVFFVRIFQKPEFDDCVLANIRIFYFNNTNFAAGWKIFRKSEKTLVWLSTIVRRLGCQVRQCITVFLRYYMFYMKFRKSGIPDDGNLT